MHLQHRLHSSSSGMTRATSHYILAVRKVEPTRAKLIRHRHFEIERVQIKGERLMAAVRSQKDIV
jgi:hypothetical protein